MEGPPGYGGPPGYDDENINAHGQHIRLLQEEEHLPQQQQLQQQQPLYQTPNTPHRSYQPTNPSYSDLGTSLAYSSQTTLVPSYVGAGSSSPTRYAPSPSPSPTRSIHGGGYAPYSPSASRVGYRGAGSAISSGLSSVGMANSQMGGVSLTNNEPPWTPSRNGDWRRPPPVEGQYEPADLNGSPRPGTPASVRSGRFSNHSARRPLPPQPMFNRGDETAIPMPIDHHSDHSFDSRHSDDEDEYTEYDSQDEYSDDAERDYRRKRRHHDEDDDESVFGPEGSNGSLDLRRPQSTSSKSLDSQKTVAVPEEEEEEHDEKTIAKMTNTQTKGEHFGPAPSKPQARRGLNRQALMTKKQVKLINGELVLECKIPSTLHSFLPRRDEKEFTHMRYTAVTCDPDDYVKRGFMLRQCLDPTRRETELFVCVTMYNEDEMCFTRTMHGVMRNIAHFCSRSKSRVWGKDGWQKIVVCIVADGRKKVHPRVLDALAVMGVYQDGIAKNYVNGRQVQAHVYEYTTQVSLDSDLKFKGAEKGIMPVQIIFCLKEQNAKKLNSHRWFFNAFGATLSPNVCILLDVGTKPGSNSLYHLWKAFDTDSNVGGACGEIKAMKGRGGVGLFNPLVASQNFEYKMSNILDKPLESVFGYITVLPGALSAYRYHALQNDESGNGPLNQYFKGETLHGKDADVFTANMYLAEDRILCWELVAKRSERWVLKYVRSATGETDVPDAVPEFVSQRRRWLNGAFFAAIYSLVHFRQIWQTDHTILRKVLLHLEFLYQAVSLLFTFFSLANFYLMFYFIAGSLSDDRLDPFGNGWGARIFVFLRFLCVLLICTQFILCMGNRPQGAKRMFTSSMAAYGIIMMYTTFCSCYIIIKSFTGSIGGARTKIELGDNLFTNLVVSTGSTIGVYFLMSFLYLDPWHMFTSSAQYFLMLPSYICTLQVYAFCNTHDVSWGTKGDNTVSIDLGAAIATKDGAVELEMPFEQLDIDSGYDDALRNLRDRVEVPKDPITEGQIKEDYYRAVRTYVVVVWMVSNAILAMVVTEVYKINDIKGNSYLKFTLWSIAALAIYRLFGSTSYLVIQGLHAFVEGKVKLDPTRIKGRFQPAWKRKGLTRKV